MMHRSVAFAFACSLLLLLGCEAGARPSDGGSGPGEESTEARCTDGVDNDGDEWIDCEDPGCVSFAHCGPGDGGPPRDGGFMGCVGTPYDAMEAFAPVDIIWVVDTSGSMSNEAERVQENMQSFAEAIGMVGIDWHVVMISTQDYVNVPEPLAIDDRYLLIDRPVSSNEPLQALLDEYPSYADHLRSSAVTHFVAVTDDESDLEWMEFRSRMLSNLGRSFVFHTISSEVAGPPNFMYPEGQPCQTSSGFPPEGAAEPGVQYWELASATGGRTFSICTPSSEWESLFDSLTAAIAIPMAIPCEYEIPDPPDDTELDFMRVNVLYTPGDGSEPQRFPYVGMPGGVDCTSGGWYYDDPEAPTRIILCPSTCELIEGDTAGRVDVELGCATFLI
ncbi:MAG TPA: VWA domain-containing protein [Sandaracinaceae bacterium LLY-WYZ-13_1]|nr:VWA domain-containing protein [Sandaracinaceae bacterium LLY-WYZ-13_1]